MYEGHFSVVYVVLCLLDQCATTAEERERERERQRHREASYQAQRDDSVFFLSGLDYLIVYMESRRGSPKKKKWCSKGGGFLFVALSAIGSMETSFRGLNPKCNPDCHKRNTININIHAHLSHTNIWPTTRRHHSTTANALCGVRVSQPTTTTTTISFLMRWVDSTPKLTLRGLSCATRTNTHKRR